jgi:general secretion pathway protein G
MTSRQSRRPRSRGFTIVEVIVMVVILGVLAAVIAPRLIQHIGGAKQSAAKAGAASLVADMTSLIADQGKPEAGSSIDILLVNPGSAAWKGPYVNNPDELKDPWGNKFILVIPGVKNMDFDIVSYGADGQPGGDGENEDIIKP